MSPYPITNLAVSYDGSSSLFKDLASLSPDNLAGIKADVLAVRKAAAVACGENPESFAALSKLPSASMVEVIKAGPGGMAAPGLSFLSAGREWRASVIEARRSGKLAVLLAGPVKSEVESLEARAERLISAHGGDVDAAIEAVAAEMEAKELSILSKCPARGNASAPKAAVPVASSPAQGSVLLLSGRERAAAAFQKQVGSMTHVATRKTSIKASRPDLSGQALAAAAINSQFGRGPSIPPPRNLPPMPKGVSRAAQAFNDQLKPSAQAAGVRLG